MAEKWFGCPGCGRSARTPQDLLAQGCEGRHMELVPADNFRDLLSAIKVWRNATESRCRLLSSRESSDSMLAPDRALIEAAERIEAEGRGAE